MSKRSLVLQHLEDVSGAVLEVYPEVIRQMIGGRSGVYALYHRGNLYYVGLASSLMGRLKGHLKDRHRGAWERFSVYLTVRHDHMKELESLILRVTGPKGNKSKGEFSGSQNLRATLNRRMKDWDADRRARLLGGGVARQRLRSKAKRSRGVGVLAGVVDRPIALRARRGTKKYKATLRRDGRIRLAGRLYDTPSAAARAATKCGLGGWTFWQYRNERRRWVQLKELRK